MKLAPSGNAPSTDSIGAGKPLVVTVKLSAWPVAHPAPAELVIAGGWTTFKLMSCVASGATPLAAVIVKR